jgi:signal transduction histidine kinase
MQMSEVLIVEDSRLFANVLSRKVRSALGHEVIIASTFQQARDLAESRELAAAVLDLQLPDAMEGEIVDYMSTVRVPSIVFTGTFDAELHKKILSKGVFDYVLKDNHDCVEAVIRSIRRLFQNQDTKLLIVDDSRTARIAIKNQLRRYGFTILEAPGGTEALEILGQFPDVKLMIVDYHMPGMDGYDLVSHVRKTHSRETLAVIGMSSKGEGALSAKFLKKGANDFLIKPFFHEELYNRILLNVETIEQFSEIRQQANRLALLNEQKNKFLGIAAHDLRNPLASIRGFSELILGDASRPLNRHQKEFLGFIRSLSNEMLQLVNDLLDVSVIESGKVDLNLKTGSLRQLVGEWVRINRIIARKKKITIHQDLAKLPDCRFDPGRIAQVVDNLLSNAIKFSNPGSKINVSLKHKDARNGGAATISVKDEGPGISPEDQVKLFGEFQKLSARPTGGEKSTGLGLSIVKKIVEAHNGAITVESTPGSGATFQVTLPLDE